MTVFYIHKSIGIALGTQESATQATMNLNGPRCFIEATQTESGQGPSGCVSECTFRPPSLSDVKDFCDRLSDEMTSHDPETTFVVYTGADGRGALMTACVIVGGYLMLRTGLSLAATVGAFRSIPDDLKSAPTKSSERQNGVTVLDCWSALDQALRLGWLVGPSSQAAPLFDVEEFAHYAHPANGGVHILAPGSLLFCPVPTDLEGGVAWADERPGGAVERRFSPAFCADLLADLGASTVLSLDAVAPSAARAYAARGMTVDGARAGRGPLSPLAALDVLMSAAGGGRAVAVAVAGLGRLRGGRGGWLGPLAAALLVSRHGFPAGAAVGWVHMLCPCMFGAADAPQQ
jgi:hypothetical protein